MFDTSKTRRLKWKARMNERKHRVAAAWNHALAGERNMMLRTERGLQRWRRNARKRMMAARRSAAKVQKRADERNRKSKHTVARKAAKAAVKTTATGAALKMANKAGKRKGQRRAQNRPQGTRRATT